MDKSKLDKINQLLVAYRETGRKAFYFRACKLMKMAE